MKTISTVFCASPSWVNTYSSIFMTKVTTTIKLKFVDLNQRKVELLAQITEENTKIANYLLSIIVGNRLFIVPKHSASLWTTYEIQTGNLQGLGVGAGFTYVGERERDLLNSFQADSYFLTNAAIFYRYRRFLNQSTKTEVVSLWSRKFIRLLLGDRDRNCFSRYGFYPSSLSSSCDISNNTREVTELSIKLGERVFQLQGQNSIFAVSDKLATALQNSPEGNINIRLVTRSGETVDSEIGKGTVKAWKAIY